MNGRSAATAVVVVGASLAGFRAAQTLRAEGFDGSLVLVGAEPHRPYERPPLSKQVLAGQWDAAKVALGGSEADLAIDWRLGSPAASLDPRARLLTLADGSRIHYDGLVIATGARARSLPGTGQLEGSFTLRTLDDALAIREALAVGSPRVAVVGAGFIGAEVAATARSTGAQVTLVEPLAVPLARALPAAIGALVAELHRDHGVDVRLGVGVAGIEGTARVECVVLSDGSTLDADVVVAGIGVMPNVEWLAGSGLPVSNGVVCDRSCAVAPGIVAAGDVACWPSARFGELARIEHYDHAVTMGEHAARTLLRAPTAGSEPPDPYDPVPWFWTDQYDRKLQLAGRVRADDQMVIVDGSLTERRFAAVFGRAGRLVGVVGMNRPAVVMRWRNRILEGTSWDDVLSSV